jgi:Flp pilus assembly protein TadG
MSSTRNRARHRRGGIRRDDRGSVAVEFAIGAPILLGIVLILLQAFVWGMGHLAAHAAADHALQTSRVVGGTAAAGQDDAAALLSQLGGSFVDDPSVTVTRDAATTTVTIHGRAHGLPLPITVSVNAPTERYTR